MHEFLASKQNFSNWIKSRINKYDFIENLDYLINKIIVQVPHQSGLRNTEVVEYTITVTMAKELAIVENMGIEWSTQQRKLTAKRWGMVKMTIPTNGDLQSRILGFALKSISCKTESHKHITN